MSVELPSLVNAPKGEISKISQQEKAIQLIDKHTKTIEQLKNKLGFREDATVVAWLLEQIEQSPDLNKVIYSLLSGQ
jgi:predicted lipase